MNLQKAHIVPVAIACFVYFVNEKILSVIIYWQMFTLSCAILHNYTITFNFENDNAVTRDLLPSLRDSYLSLPQKFAFIEFLCNFSLFYMEMFHN